MAKGKPTPEVRTPAPADPLDAFDVVAPAPEGEEPPPDAGEVRASAPPDTPATPGPEADAATPAPTRFAVRVPGCTLPQRVVEAATPAEAVEKYKTLFGVTAFGAGPEVTPVAWED